jgi:HSP20 family protein
MNIRDLVPWTRGSDQTPNLYRDEGLSSLSTLHREMNRLFEEVLRGFDSPSLFGRRQALGAMNWPRIEVNETDKEIVVSAEIPGLDEKDVELLIDDGRLIVRGEKRAEVEDKERQFSERFYGRFEERHIPLGVDIDEDKIEASFKNDVLKVTLPKSGSAQAKMRRIEINAPTKN